MKGSSDHKATQTGTPDEMETLEQIRLRMEGLLRGAEGANRLNQRAFNMLDYFNAIMERRQRRIERLLRETDILIREPLVQAPADANNNHITAEQAQEASAQSNGNQEKTREGEGEQSKKD